MPSNLFYLTVWNYFFDKKSPASHSLPSILSHSIQINIAHFVDFFKNRNKLNQTMSKRTERNETNDNDFTISDYISLFFWHGYVYLIWIIFETFMAQLLHAVCRLWACIVHFGSAEPMAFRRNAVKMFEKSGKRREIFLFVLFYDHPIFVKGFVSAFLSLWMIRKSSGKG